MTSCKTHGLWTCVWSTVQHLVYEYRLRRFLHSISFKTTGTGLARKIFYIDFFHPANSNFYWLKAFHRFGQVKTFDIRRENRQLLESSMADFRPVHIHLGGSVKDWVISPQLLSDVKRVLNCTISVFFGDPWYSLYHCELAEAVDYVYMSNMSHIRKNAGKGHLNFRYMPCPTDPDVFKCEGGKKIHDLVFIGSNHQSYPSRLSMLKKLAEHFNLKVFGNGWENTGLNYGSPVYGPQFSRVCNQARICLGIVDDRYTDLEAYFSNRLVNTLATRSFLIHTYTPGLENVFTNRKHLIWYTNEEELFRQVEYYLEHDMEREKIAVEGQREVYLKYTYIESARRMLQDVGLDTVINYRGKGRVV